MYEDGWFRPKSERFSKLKVTITTLLFPRKTYQVCCKKKKEKKKKKKQVNGAPNFCAGVYVLLSISLPSKLSASLLFRCYFIDDSCGNHATRQTKHSASPRVHRTKAKREL